MPAFKITLLGLLYFFITLALGSKCPQDSISKLVVCYYKSETSLTHHNICNCTHLVFTNAVKRAENNSFIVGEDTTKLLETVKERKENLSTLFTIETKEVETSAILKSENRSKQLINEIVEFLLESEFDGIELNLKFASDDGVQKESYAAFVKRLSKTLSSHHRRIKREGYDVFEKLTDDITTASYTTQTPKNSTSKAQSIKQGKPKENNRKIRENNDDNDQKSVDYVTLEEAINGEFSQEKSQDQITLKDVEEEIFKEKKYLVFVRLPIEPEIVARKYDLKVLSRYSDVLTIPTHNIVNRNEEHLTYHPSRLMGLSDILNTDSILDFLTAMGAPKSKMVISLPATVLKFQLKDENKNTPSSPAKSKPQVIDQSQLCSLFNKNNWTIERDDDLTAPYAFSGKTWLAFEDEISVNIKGKYILLRELAGGAIYPIDADVNDGLRTNYTGKGGYLSGILHKNFESLERKPRALVLESLQEQIHDTAFTNVEAGVRLSEYRIVRVVDHSGAVHVIRKNTKTQFECSRQGYFSHPLGCNKFYRCVKFDQYSDEFTVFEYDCPAGLAFDERWEVCVWPGSLPHGAPCTGSSEIAPVPRSHYQCPNREGYYADPENCRWFFACLDHSRDGITPLTAYEFRCPFGLVFSEEKLACDWPWLVGSCGNRGAAGYLQVSAGGQSQGFHSATFINGGNLEASLGQYGNTEQESAFASFGKKFGTVLKGTNTYNAAGAYQGAQSAGFGYIASQYDDRNDRASFAAFPDYQISGGRILNKGGLVLDQNIAGISSISAGGAVGGLGALNVKSGASKSLGTETGYLQQGIGQVVSGIQSTSNTEFHKVGSVMQADRLDIAGISSGGQASFQHSISTPRPFAVNIPSVQINSEKVSEYSGHSTTIGQTTPQTLIFQGTPPTENVKIINGKGVSTQGFTVSQPTLSVGIPAVTPTTEPHTSGGIISGASHLSTPSVSFVSSPKIETHRFGKNQFSNEVSINQAAVTAGIPAITGTLKYGSTVSSGKSEVVPITVPLVTPKPDFGAFEYTASGFGVGIGKSSSATETPFGGLTQLNSGLTDQAFRRKSVDKSAISVEIPAKIPLLQTHVIKNINAGQNFESAKATFGQTGVSYEVPVLTATPSVFTNVGKIGSESHLSTTYSGPTLAPLAKTSIDQKISNELRFNTPQISYSVPSVTPKTDFGAFSKAASKIPVITGKPDQQIFSQAVTGKYENAVTYGIPVVTPQPELNSFKFYGERTNGFGVTPIVPFGSSQINAGVKKSFGQSVNLEVPKGFSPAAYNVPDVVPKNQIHVFQQEGISQAEEGSYSIPAVAPNTIGQISHTFVTPKPDIKFSQPVQSGFGQRYAYSSSLNEAGSQFKTVQPFRGVGSTEKPTDVFGPKLEQSSILTDVSIKQQQVVGSIGSTSIDHALSTPSSSASVNIFPQTPTSGTINFKSSYVQPQTVTLTTALPDISVNPSKPATYELNQPSPHSLNIFGKSLTHYQGEKLDADISVPALQQTVTSGPGTGIFSQKSFKQEIKSFSPAVTTAVPLSYNEGISTGFGSKYGFYDQSVYLSPVTPKTEVFGATLQKNSHVSFGTAEENHLLQKEQPKLIVNQIQQQVPVQIPTTVSNYQHVVKIAQPTGTTSKPFTLQEKLVELDIKKSVEINPAVISKSVDAYLPPNPSGGQFIIQHQPLHLVSQKTFPVKQVLKPSLEQKEKEIVHINSIPENTYQEQFAFQQVDVKTQEQKQYIPPAVTPVPSVSYSTAKTVNFPQPAVFSEGNAGVSSIVQPSKFAFASHTEAITSGNKINAGFEKSPEQTIFVQQYGNRQPEIVSSKVNLLLPTVTELPNYTSSQAEEVSVQTHRNFDSKKISKTGSLPVQNVFIHQETGTTLKPFFGNSGQLFQYNRGENLTSGHSAFESGITYGINPNIAIPEPPREYILAQNAYTTIAPEIVTAGRTSGRFQSTESISSGTTYLPPKVAPRRKPSKATVISVGKVNEEISDDNIQQVFDKYSGRFGQVINRKSDKFVTKIISGEGKGRIEIDKQGSSTVQYEVSSTTPRQRARGRQYHGGITSGVQATNKYEEYEIDGQRSFDVGQDKSDGSKTTIDLKNLKLEKDKKTVIVVSQVSDANPILIGKLAGQCSCQSNMIELKSKGNRSKSSSRRTNLSQNQQQHPTIINEYLPPYEDDQASSAVQFFAKDEVTAAAPDPILIGGRKSTNGISYTSEQNFVPSSTTVHPDVVSSTILSSLGTNGVLSITPKSLYDEDRQRNRKKQFRGKTRFLPPAALTEDGSSVSLLSPVSASDIAFDYSALKGDESRTQNEIDGGSSGGNPKVFAGAAFDRYGPGGWRSFDETLQGSIDCKRPGLFRHPKYCNKFYACNYDPWKEQYTLHVFNCPIRLTYDSSISACNWPVRGPACADDNLLV